MAGFTTAHFCERGGRLIVNSAYGSKDIPKGKASKGLKEAARAVLTNIIKERARRLSP
jgi:hypothetical protein